MSRDPEIRSATVDAGGLELAVVESGAGGRPLLLAHGFTGAKEDFADVLVPLARLGWHAVAVDLRGHGGSAKPEGLEHYGLDVLAADLLGLADALGWDHFALVGHSMGGMVAQLAALAAPGRIDGLILVGTGHGSVEGIERSLAEWAVAVVAGAGIDQLADILAGMAGMAGMGGMTSTAAHRRLVADRPGYTEYGDRKLRATAPDLYRVLALELLDHDDRLDRLAGLDVPVLVVVGEQDSTFLAASRRLAATIPGAELVVVPDAGHSPQFENPAFFGQALERFLGRLEVRR